MQVVRWLGGIVLGVGAVLAAVLVASSASAGDAIYIQRLAPVVLSGAQKTAVGNWARSVWPSLVAANVDRIQCDHKPTIEGQGANAVVDFAGAWECSACEIYSPTASEMLDLELEGKSAGPGLKCYKAKASDGTLTPAHVGGLNAFARDLANAGASTVVGHVMVARTPGKPTHITADVGILATATPAAWLAAKALGDQPGGVVRTLAKVQ